MIENPKNRLKSFKKWFLCQTISKFDVECSSESLLDTQSALVSIEIFAKVLTKDKSLEFIQASTVICLMLTKLKSKLNKCLQFIEWIKYS